MAHDNALRMLFMSQREGIDGLQDTNESMVAELVLSGALQTPGCTAAFRAVDRGHFWPAAEGGRDLAYADMPLRSGRLHLSAPHIYARAIESLSPLDAGMSFLNVGSGTGYFNSIVSELIGPLAINHGVEIWPEAVAHARERCQLIGKQHIEHTRGNVYELDVGSTMRYDRIYLGACANSRSKYLYRLLEVGGILIGPFQAGHTQQLRRVVRRTETQFHVEVLGSVQFSTLVEPSPPAAAAFAPPDRAFAAAPIIQRHRLGSEDRSPLGLQGVPFTFALRELPWSPERSRGFPASFGRVVMVALTCRPRDTCKPFLPPEVWVRHVLPWCPRCWFEASRGAEESEAPALLGMAELTPAKSKAAADEQSDDDMSTAAVTSADASSTAATPESGPIDPPGDLESMQGSPTREPAPAPQFDEMSGDTLFEVFGDGQRHAIGGADDPDDRQLEDPPGLVVPLHVLQLLLANARGRRVMDDSDEDGADSEEGDGEEEMELDEAPSANVAEDSHIEADSFDMAGV